MNDLFTPDQEARIRDIIQEILHTNGRSAVTRVRASNVELPESMSDEGRAALRRAISAVVTAFTYRAAIPTDDELLQLLRKTLSASDE